MFKKYFASSRSRRSAPRTPQVVTISDDDTEVEDDSYEVESIRGKKIDDNNRLYYLVKWKGYDGEESWEPAEGCNCDMKIQEYEKLESLHSLLASNRSFTASPSTSESPSVASNRQSPRKRKSSTPSKSVKMTRNRRSNR